MSFYIKMSEDNIDAQNILYMRRTGAYGKENYELMSKFKNWLNEHNLFNDETVIVAVALDNPNVTEPQNCRYDVCVLNLTDEIPRKDEVSVRQLDGGKYITFLIEHTAQAVSRAWGEFFLEMQKNGYQLDISRPIMERYAKRMVDNNYCELCVPVM